MQFTCLKSELSDAISVVSRAMAQRTSIPLIEGILLTGARGRIELLCTDLKLSIKSTVHADFDGEFSCVMPGKLFSEVVRRLPEDDVTVTLKEANEGSYTVTVVCRDSRTTLTALNADEFPRVQDVEDPDAIEIEERALRDMIRQTAFAVSTDNTRPIFTGELMEAEENGFNLVALDGFRFAMRTKTLEKTGPARRCVVPGRAMLEVMHILEDTDEKIRVHLVNKNFMMQKGETRVMTRLLEGDFIRYQQIIPKDSPILVRMDVEALRSAISRAELIAQNERINLVKLNIGEDEIIVTAQSEEGNVRERVSCETQGGELEVAFNIRYLADVLRALECDEVIMYFTSAVSACVMKGADADANFLYLVLPVQL